MKQSFSTSEVAKYCHVTADTIRKWAEAGRIVVFKTPGGHRRIRREDLMTFLRENRIPFHPDLVGQAASILVVSGDPEVVKAVHDTVKRSNTEFQVLVAQDSFEAGRQTAVFAPGIVIVDLESRSSQPPMAGSTENLCARIASSPDLAHTSLIAVTRADDGQLGARAIEQGATACLRKPLDSTTFRQALADVGVSLS